MKEVQLKLPAQGCAPQCRREYCRQWGPMKVWKKIRAGGKFANRGIAFDGESLEAGTQSLDLVLIVLARIARLSCRSRWIVGCRGLIV